MFVVVCTPELLTTTLQRRWIPPQLLEDSPFTLKQHTTAGADNTQSTLAPLLPAAPAVPEAPPVASSFQIAQYGQKHSPERHKSPSFANKAHGQSPV